MFSCAAGLLLLIAAFYFLFQHETVYKYSLGIIAGNYRNDNGQIIKSRIPYEKFDTAKMYRWDANLYRQIKDNGYNTNSAGGDYIFAFFPLFPFAWKIAGLTTIQISIVNYSLWIISLIVITSFMTGKDIKGRWKFIAILAGIPMLVVFLIPYSEGLYMITLTIALWGLYKNNYVIYFIAALLAAMTRSSVTVLLLAIFFTEFYFFLRRHHVFNAIKSFALKSLPLILGTLMVSFIQYSFGSNHFAKFIEAEKYWGYALQLPGGITDWAHEQFCTNLPLVLFALPVMLTFLAYNSWKNISDKTVSNIERTKKSSDYNREYLFILSIFYLTGIILTIILLRGGSLNGISRYVFCTPFYIIALFMLRKKTTRVKNSALLFTFTIAVILAVIALSVVNYSKHWNFSDFGFMLLYFQIAFFIFTKLITNRWLVTLFFVLSALWASYLFSMFISNAWIIT